MALQVLVHIARFEGVALPVGGVVLEQVLARNLLAFAHQPGQAGVVQRHVVGHALFAHEVEVHGGPVHGHVLVAQGGEAVAGLGLAVLLRVFLVANPDKGLVHEREDHGHHLFAVQGRPGEVFAQLLAQGAQLLAKGAQARKLGQAAQLIPGRVVAVLLAAQAIAAGHLQMGGGRGGNPHLRPGGRNHEAFDAGQRVGGGDFLALRVVVREPPGAGGLAGQAGALVGGVAQAGHARLPGRVFVHDVGLVFGQQGFFAGFGARRGVGRHVQA